jgi:hypothetical protein
MIKDWIIYQKEMIMLRTPVFKFVQIGAVALLVLAFTMGAAGAQPARAANSTDTEFSAGWMPFTGGLYDSQTNTISSLNGLVHISRRGQRPTPSMLFFQTLHW